MTKRLINPADDPALFEYSPKDVPDEDCYEMMAMRNTSPNELVDPVDRERYRQYLKQNGYAS